MIGENLSSEVIGKELFQKYMSHMKRNGIRK